MLKPCTQAGVCGASPGCPGTYVPGSGLLQAPHCLFLFPFSVAGYSFYVVRAAYNVMYERYFFPSQSLFLFKLFFRQFAVAFGFRHYWGVCLHLLPWSLHFFSHFFMFCISPYAPSSRAVMGLELGLYAHF